MVERVPDAAAAARAFRNLADAEQSRVPTYARICRIIADRPDVHSMLLEAPTGQRLPVLLLAAIHDVVLRDPAVALAPWYPSVTGEPASTEDPTDALLAVVDEHRAEILEMIRTRQVQTNEVNRCVAWQLALGELCAADRRPLSLVEVGASAGLNLRFDDDAIELVVDGEPGRTTVVGRVDSSVRLSTVLRTGPWPGPAIELPPVAHRVGLDLHPLDVTDADDARWLAACTWPEQRERFARLAAAIERARLDPPPLVTGDLVDDVADLIRSCPDDTHVVVLASWALTYVERARRVEFVDRLVGVASDVERRGGRLSLATLDAAHTLPWVDPPEIAAGADADHRHASLLSISDARPDGLTTRPLAWTQAHLAWVERLD